MAADLPGLVMTGRGSASLEQELRLEGGREEGEEASPRLQPQAASSYSLGASVGLVQRLARVCDFMMASPGAGDLIATPSAGD